MRNRQFLVRRLPLAALVVAAGLVVAPAAEAAPLTVEDFRSTTTEGILRLCTAPKEDALHEAAMGYCVGYLAGAFDYYRIAESIGSQPRVVCFGDPPPTRREEIEKFVAWAKTHPEHGAAPAIDSLFRFLGGEHPCP